MRGANGSGEREASKSLSPLLATLFYFSERETLSEKTLKMSTDEDSLPPLRLAVLGAGTFALAAWAPLLK